MFAGLPHQIVLFQKFLLKIELNNLLHYSFLKSILQSNKQTK